MSPLTKRPGRNPVPEAAIVDAHSQEKAEQRQLALRSLLMRPLMGADHPVFARVRAHADYLRAWFARECGWTLRIERTHARLCKRVADTADATRGAKDFTRERYILLCLSLAVLDREDIQITLARLGERLMVEALDSTLASAGFEFGLDRQSQRRDLVHVCRLLLDLGVITRVAGDEAAYINQSGDALYDIHRPVLATLLVGERGPSALAAAETTEARLAALAADAPAEGDDAQRTALRHGLARRLLDDPVLYLDTLTVDEREYFLGQRGPMGRRLADAAGLHAEHRAEGSALVDAGGELTDVALPQQGTDAHATLLLAEYLAARERRGATGPLPWVEIEAFMRQAARDYRKYWRKAAQEAGAERALAQTAVDRLAALGLVERGDDTIQALAAVSRFKLGETHFKQADLWGQA